MEGRWPSRETLSFELFNTSGTLDSNPTLDIRAGNFSVGGFLDAFIENFNGNITGSAEIELTLSGNLTVQQDANFEIANFNPKNGAGSIGGSARIDVVAASLTASSLNAVIDNEEGGSIGAFAEINFFMPAGALTTQGSASFGISNDVFKSGSGGGLITNSAIVDITAASISAGGQLNAFVSNSSGGMIGSDAQVKIHSGGISADSGISTKIFNQGGSVGGNALISFNSTADVVTDGFDFFDIQNASGSIGGGASVVGSIAGNYTSARIEATIDNQNGTIGGTASIMFNVGGNISSFSDAFFTIDNSNGGAIGVTPAISVTANNIMAAGDFAAYINTSSNGAPTSDSGSTVRIEAFGEIHVGGRLNVLGSVITDGDIGAQTIAATSVDTSGGGDIIAGFGGIRRFAVPGQRAPDLLHTLSARFVTSDGGINFDGSDSDGFSAATAGGSLTINTLSGISFDSEGDIRGSVTLNGGTASGTFVAGDGGNLTVNSGGDISVDAPIEATTGALSNTGGRGGNVNLNSSAGTVA